LRTYVKIEGENASPIIQKLAKLAVNMPEICVWDYNLLSAGWSIPSSGSEMAGYFDMDTSTFEKECDKIVAKPGADLEENSLYFEWMTPPSREQLHTLRKSIIQTIEPFGNKYTITNKE
jgi:hypothetical protein